MKTTLDPIEIQDHYLAAYETHAHLYSSQRTSLRKMAIEEFAAIGFPTPQHEEWKYFDLRPILQNPFSIATPEVSTLTEADVARFKILGSDALVMVFVNGTYQPHLSSINLATHFTVMPFADAHQHPTFKTYFAKQASFLGEAFVALNTAFYNDGCLVYLNKNTTVLQPIHLLHITTATAEGIATFPRNLIVLDQGSKAQIIATYHTLSHHQPTLTNAVNEIILGEQAMLEFDIKQNEAGQAYHINYTEALLHKNATFDISTITVNGQMVRNNLHIVLADVNCTTHLHGLNITNGQQVVDNHTLVDHAAPHCFSNELYKSILSDKAIGIFNGKIFVRKDAQKTNAFQSNKAILLNDEATMNAKPQLEIFADDVKCSHGATTGQLDEEALFYLRSRGINPPDAKALLNFAFASDVLSNINNPHLKANLLKLLAKKLNSHIEFDLA